MSTETHSLTHLRFEFQHRTTGDSNHFTDTRQLLVKDIFTPKTREECEETLQHKQTFVLENMLEACTFPQWLQAHTALSASTFTPQDTRKIRIIVLMPPKTTPTKSHPKISFTKPD